MSSKNNQISRPPTVDDSHAVNKSQIANNSHLSNLNEDENLIRTKANGIMSARSVDSPEKSNTATPVSDSGKSLGIDIGEYKPLTCREKFGAILMSKYMDWFFIILIILYMMLVVANTVIDDGSCVTDPGILLAINILGYIEVGIVSLFILEIVLKAGALGLKGYFKDCWYVIDAIIILITFALVLVDINVQQNINGLSQVRGLFRLFRIFLLYRKATTFTNVAKKRILTNGYNIKSPVEKVLELLESLRKFTKDKETLKDINWAIEIVSSNKLYEVIIERKPGDEGNKELSEWIKSYAAVTPNLERRKARLPTAKTNDEKKGPNIETNTSLPQEVTTILDKDAYELGFDVFKFSSIIPGKELSSLMHYLFDKQNLFESLEINIKTFTRLAEKIQHGYRNNPYHNAIHATDVLQTVAYLTIKCGFKESAELDQFELAAFLFSAAIHDYDHPGYNNMYHVNAQHELAIRYNDKAVLENYHVACAYTIMQDKEYNIFANLSNTDYKGMREKIIALILATDMSQHFAEVGLMKTRLAADFDKKQKDKLLSMKMILHSSDISNPSKSWPVCEEWAKRCLEEFWAQGDLEREKGLPVSYLCDRYTTNTSKSQVGFMDIFVQPTWEVLSQVLTGLDLSNFEVNKSNWKAREAYYDEELKKLNAEKAEKEKNEIPSNK